MTSLIFLAFSMIGFVITYGILFILSPIILGSFFFILDDVEMMDEGWTETYIANRTTIQFLIELIPSIGVFIIILKVLLLASARGND